ncbi:hypothetical protein Pcinc_009967 [Petrolisthes cinctipes]|uniref:Uncharacterized protein n=1 Tax=Petrolisthes cinctipes TaxID=88211 RepID=A0AAE1G496_PETCI|nr:hypothetical protein Pcinc_009967 [Petrolisthes cinctipes]
MQVEPDDETTEVLSENKNEGNGDTGWMVGKGRNFIQFQLPDCYCRPSISVFRDGRCERPPLDRIVKEWQTDILHKRMTKQKKIEEALSQSQNEGYDSSGTGGASRIRNESQCSTDSHSFSSWGWSRTRNESQCSSDSFSLSRESRTRNESQCSIDSFSAGRDCGQDLSQDSQDLTADSQEEDLKGLSTESELPVTVLPDKPSPLIQEYNQLLERNSSQKTVDKPDQLMEKSAQSATRSTQQAETIPALCRPSTNFNFHIPKLATQNTFESSSELFKPSSKIPTTSPQSFSLTPSSQIRFSVPKLKMHGASTTLATPPSALSMPGMVPVVSPEAMGVHSSIGSKLSSFSASHLQQHSQSSLATTTNLQQPQPCLSAIGTAQSQLSPSTLALAHSQQYSLSACTIAQSQQPSSLAPIAAQPSPSVNSQQHPSLSEIANTYTSIREPLSSSLGGTATGFRIPKLNFSKVNSLSGLPADFTNKLKMKHGDPPDVLSRPSMVREGTGRLQQQVLESSSVGNPTSLPTSFGGPPLPPGLPPPSGPPPPPGFSLAGFTPGATSSPSSLSGLTPSSNLTNLSDLNLAPPFGVTSMLTHLATPSSLPPPAATPAPQPSIPTPEDEIDSLLRSTTGEEDQDGMDIDLRAAVINTPVDRPLDSPGSHDDIPFMAVEATELKVDTSMLKSSPSAFGKVMTLLPTGGRRLKRPMERNIEVPFKIFKFDTPSPDERVQQAINDPNNPARYKLLTRERHSRRCLGIEG